MHTFVNSQVNTYGCHHARMNNIRANLERFLASKSWTVAYFARLTKISQPTMQRLIAGSTKSPSIDTVDTIAKRMGVTIDDLVHNRLFTGMSVDPHKVAEEPMALQILASGHPAKETASMIESLGLAGHLEEADLKLLSRLASRLAKD